MFCPKCGSEAGANDAFCRNCGAPLSPVEPKKNWSDRIDDALYGFFSSGDRRPPEYPAPDKPVKQEENPSGWWGALGFFAPTVGLVLYLVWNEEFPQTRQKDWQMRDRRLCRVARGHSRVVPAYGFAPIDAVSSSAASRGAFCLPNYGSAPLLCAACKLLLTLRSPRLQAPPPFPSTFCAISFTPSLSLAIAAAM